MIPLALAAVLGALPPALAPEPPGGGPPAPEPRAVAPPARDALRVYEVRLAVDVPVTLGAAALAALPYRFSSSLIAPRCPCDRREVPRLERFAVGLHSGAADVASDVVVVLAVGAPLARDALRLGLGPALGEDAEILAETLAVNSALVVLAKYAAQRPLPRTYAGDPELVASPRGYRSFYSGHTSTAVSALAAAAWTEHLRDGPSVWPWLVAAGAGAGVGVLRVAAGRHFPSDVAMGALAGFGVGTVVPLLHARRLSVLPAPGGLAIGAPF
ncbi:MAG TPA: phosphatase PAP2 family protein [Anaeromyxobacter sp.]